MEILLTATEATVIYKISHQQIQRAVDAGELVSAGRRKGLRGPSAKYGAPVYRAPEVEALAKRLGKRMEISSELQADHFWLMRHLQIDRHWRAAA